ncbi:response regulator transcription factor [Amycolatopsis rhabdoformis]|uniref:Response regulator transcription factor n=1 Tax=Amycolatopsis rhabdoformis TaxID=1448059 RepID=A0ABZ1IFJ0_9PSEU|nr:response regulator transcription factor [Amycolatopsis rhabdoformis]WSE32516.1 response regulator transcription factor [Amycolatopsis rhabdoformis]
MCAYVLVAEDDLKQAELVRRYLRHEGHSVQTVADGQAALDEVRRRQPDLLVLDLMLPSLSGLEVCRHVRREFALPVLMVTAKSTVNDRLRGFDLGADDYLVKPYDPRELVARARVLLRRADPGDQGGPPLRVGDLVLDPERFEVRVGDRAVECTAAEFRILTAMISAPGRVFSRAQLVERVYGIDAFITERTIDVHVKNLRKKIEPDPRHPEYLLTVFGVGYKVRDAR